MKIRHISILSILCLLSLSGVAQRNKVNAADRENFFRFGAKAGVNINKITGQSYNSGFRYNYQLGGFVQFNFSSRFGLQPEVNLVQVSAELTDDATDIYDDLFRDGSQKTAKLNYLEIPVLLNVNLGVSKHVKFQIGTSYAMLLQEKISNLIRDTAFYKNGEWAAIGGLWIQLPFFNIGARYRLGLSNINAIDNRQSWRNQAIQIFAGFTF